MATWNSSKKFEYQTGHKSYNGDHDFFEWEYQTTADILTIRNTAVDGQDAYGHGAVKGWTREDHMGPKEAEALYLALRNWLRVYCGDRSLARLDLNEPLDSPNLPKV